jgi:hypothetical protein
VGAGATVPDLKRTRERERCVRSAVIPGFAFDRDAHLVDADKQASVKAELKLLGISFESLKLQLLTENWNVHIYEYVAMKRELKLREIDPLLVTIERCSLAMTPQDYSLLGSMPRLNACAPVPRRCTTN